VKVGSKLEKKPKYNKEYYNGQKPMNSFVPGPHKWTNTPKLINSYYNGENPQNGQKPTNSKSLLKKVKPQSKSFILGQKAITQNKHGQTLQYMTIVRGKNPV
jgi:hypothetical protein